MYERQSSSSSPSIHAPRYLMSQSDYGSWQSGKGQVHYSQPSKGGIEDPYMPYRQSRKEEVRDRMWRESCASRNQAKQKKQAVQASVSRVKRKGNTHQTGKTGHIYTTDEKKKARKERRRQKRMGKRARELESRMHREHGTITTC